MSVVFVNYRNRDSEYGAALLDDRLSAIFGAEAIFRAGRSLTAGSDYKIGIIEAVRRSRVMLAVVGPGWHERFQSDAAEGVEDWVRKEIREALHTGIPVVPVLLTGAARLSQVSLPADIADLSQAQYLRFEHRNITEDANRIAAELRTLCPELAALPRARQGRSGLWSRIRGR
ncbi:TIR domain-containing protein [Crossiella cryophila]|uniref:TIR domain-containing protein n=1 Tax=Crossiella cryophila TaxID=43355 RepID=A0A7W7C740_9PSEU|nr:TIR domain-containing protein [Crossiella cryophila]MBB4674626.1 hypothetical protein [Crossiella cryophila]